MGRMAKACVGFFQESSGPELFFPLLLTFIGDWWLSANCKWQGAKLPGSSDPCWFGQDQMLERRLVAGAVAYSAMFLDHEVQVNLKAATVMLGLKEKSENKNCRPVNLPLSEYPSNDDDTKALSLGLRKNKSITFVNIHMCLHPKWSGIAGSHVNLFDANKKVAHGVKQHHPMNILRTVQMVDERRSSSDLFNLESVTGPWNAMTTLTWFLQFAWGVVGCWKIMLIVSIRFDLFDLNICFCFFDLNKSEH